MTASEIEKRAVLIVRQLAADVPWERSYSPTSYRDRCRYCHRLNISVNGGSEHVPFCIYRMAREAVTEWDAK
jgi:hypothetical protein